MDIPITIAKIPENALRRQPKVNLSTGVWILFFTFFLVYAGQSMYPMLSLLSFGILLLIIKFFWKFNQPAVVLFWFLYQWLQIFSAIILSDYLDRSMNYWTRTDTGEFTYFLSLAGLVVQVAVVGLVLKNKRINIQRQELIKIANKIIIKRVIYLYVFFSVLHPILFNLAINTPQLNQIIILFASLKFIFLVLLILLFVIRKEQKLLITIILCFEFLSGFLTYFSSFKEVFLFGIIAYLSFVRSIKLSIVLRFIPLILLLFLLLIFWSASKEDYRKFVNQGSQVQRVQVSSGDAFEKLINLGKNFDSKTFETGLRGSLFRLQYIFFFSQVTKRIPSSFEYQGGKVWGEALQFTLIPRFLDPNKGTHDPSLKTNKYTGLKVAGMARGTAISIGYFGDSYIDFGPWGMMVPIGLVALLIALLYIMILSFKLNLLFRYAIIITVLTNVGYFESDSIFVLGMLKNHFIFQIVLYLLAYKSIDKYIQGQSGNSLNKRGWQRQHL